MNFSTKKPNITIINKLFESTHLERKKPSYSGYSRESATRSVHLTDTEFNINRNENVEINNLTLMKLFKSNQNLSNENFSFKIQDKNQFKL